MTKRPTGPRQGLRSGKRAPKNRRRKQTTLAPPGIASLDALPNPFGDDVPKPRYYRRRGVIGAPVTIERAKVVPQRPKISPDSALRLIPKLPGMKPQEIAQLFVNSVGNLADPAKAYLHDATRMLLDAISDEWRHREKAGNPDDYFQWPSTDAAGGDGGLTGRHWPAEGLLKFMGYTVGATQGERAQVRELILARVFSDHLPQIVSPDYMMEWGRPKTAGRLRKMAETIAALTRNAKRRRDRSFDQAIRDWEHDLSFLYHTYYVGHFGFGWPSTSH